MENKEELQKKIEGLEILTNQQKQLIDQILTINNQLIINFIPNKYSELPLPPNNGLKCKTFVADDTTSSATKCQLCGKEKIEHSHKLIL